MVICIMDNTLWQNISKMALKPDGPFSWEELKKMLEERDENDNRNKLVPNTNN